MQVRQMVVPSCSPQKSHEVAFHSIDSEDACSKLTRTLITWLDVINLNCNSVLGTHPLSMKKGFLSFFSL